MRRLSPLLAAALSLSGCGGSSTADPVRSSATDADGDGVLEFEDCDDANPDVYPGAPEVCDGLDNNCDGAVDGADPLVDLTTGGTWPVDADGDGYGDPDATVSGCTQPEGSADDASDCDDSSERVHPGAEEACGDGIDQDCDGRDLRCAPQGVLSISGADATVRGAPDTSFGEAVLGAFDVDLDGRPDLLVGASRASNGSAENSGAVSLFLGGLEGDRALTDADATLPGASAGDRLGHRLAAWGDETAWTAPEGGANGGGAVHLWAASPDGLPRAIADLHTFTAPPNAVFGYSAALGDLDGTPTADLAAGAIGVETGGFAAGAVWLLGDATEQAEGSVEAAGVALHGAAGDSAGWDVAVGDLDGDGLGDLVIGAPGRRPAGAAFVVSGPITADAALDDVGVRIDGADRGFRMGERVAAGADLDLDGYGDLLLTDKAHAGTKGGAWLLSGPVTDETRLEADAQASFTGGTDDFLGHAASFAGDIDGDGRTDLILAGEKNDEAWLFYGPVSGTFGPSDSDGRLTGSSGAALGAAVGAAGDQDGDGFDDLFISDPDAHSVFIFLGGRR